MKCGVIIVAAGQGIRLGQPSPKAFVLLGGKPLYQFSLSVFASHQGFEEGVLVVHESKKEIEAHPFKVVPGGKTRQESVARGLEVLSKECEGVLIHDAARPFVTAAMIDRLFEELKKNRNAIVTCPVVDTIKWVEENRIQKTIDRQNLRAAQTPQGFQVSLLKKAMKQALEEGWEVTDEAMLLEKIGIPVYEVEGDPLNIKITTQKDLKLAETIYANRSRL